MLEFLKGKRNTAKQTSAAVTAQTESILNESGANINRLHQWARAIPQDQASRSSSVEEMPEYAVAVIQGQTATPSLLARKGTPEPAIEFDKTMVASTSGAVQPRPKLPPAQSPKVTLPGSAEHRANDPSSGSVPGESAPNKTALAELDQMVSELWRFGEGDKTSGPSRSEMHVVEEHLVTVQVVERQSAVTTTTATPFLSTEKSGLELPEEAMEADETMTASTFAQPQPELTAAQSPKAALAGSNGSWQNLFAEFDAACSTLANGNDTAAQYARAFSQDISKADKQTLQTIIQSITHAEERIGDWYTKETIKHSRKLKQIPMDYLIQSLTLISNQMASLTHDDRARRKICLKASLPDIAIKPIKELAEDSRLTRTPVGEILRDLIAELRKVNHPSERANSV